MALNAASHNPSKRKLNSQFLIQTDTLPAGTPTGSPSGPPPPTSSGTTDALKKAADQDVLAQNAGGKDAGSAIGSENGAASKPKTAKEREDDPGPV